MDGGGYADAADLCKLLDARGDVHAIAIDIAVLEDDVAEVDADAELDAPVGRHVGIAPPHAVLDLDGGAHSVSYAVELDQQAVASGLDDAAIVLFDDGIDELDAMGPEASERAALVHLHEPTVADHVRRHDRRKPVFHRGRRRLDFIKVKGRGCDPC